MREWEHYTFAFFAGALLKHIGIDILRLAFEEETADQPGQVSTPGDPIEKRLTALSLSTSHSKVAVARKIVAVWTDQPDWPLDLKGRVEMLASFIQACQTVVPATSRSVSSTESNAGANTDK